MAVTLAATAAVAIIAGVFFLRSQAGGADLAEATRRSLRRQGFKTELSEFDFSTSPEMQIRASALTNADIITPGIQGRDYARRSVLWQYNPELMALVGPDVAVVAWEQERLSRYSREDLWAALREILSENSSVLDAACEAALAGPIGFDLNAGDGNAMLLLHLGRLQRLAEEFGTRAVLELHDGNQAAAWTNVLAATRLITAWDPERVEGSYMVRYGCLEITYGTIWQALQAGGWSEDQLARLQAEWAGADLFKGLPDTAAFNRARMVATCKQDRQQPLPPAVTATQILHSPRAAWYNANRRSRRARYREEGTYEDEAALLLYYRDREVQLWRAVQAHTWSEMRRFPGVTNTAPFRSRDRSSHLQLMMDNMRTAMRIGGGGVSLLGLAAQAEARRRLVVTAVALERYHARFGSYPKDLAELVPGLLPSLPMDFMDGQPLRYRLRPDGHFVLYSVGLDCVDNGGTAPPTGRRESLSRSQEFGAWQGTDLVWPRPASGAEVKAQE